MPAWHLRADENVPAAVVHGLRQVGHDVVWVLEDMPGADDPTILARAQVERRIILTYDKDFGELAFHAGLPGDCGVILIRLRGSTPDTDDARAVGAVTSLQVVAGYFIIVEDDRIRVRSLRAPTA